MRTRQLGASGVQAGVVGLGTWAIGGWMWGGTNIDAASDTIRAALDAGISLIDTAPIYGFGLSEEIVGRAIAGRRDEAVLATKCGLVWDRTSPVFHFSTDQEGLPGQQGSGQHDVYRLLRPESIRTQLEQSLSRLGTDHIDLYQTHWPDASTPVEDTMAELLRLKDEGKIRAIGVSNAERDLLERYRSTGQIDTDQERYSMIDRAPEESQLSWCAEHDVAFLAYGPLAMGLLTERGGPERTFDRGDIRSQRERFSVSNRVKIKGMLDELREVAQRRRLTLGQLAIAWCLHQRGCTHVLVGARTPQQALENAAAADAALDEVDLAQIRLILRTDGAEIV